MALLALRVPFRNARAAMELQPLLDELVVSQEPAPEAPTELSFPSRCRAGQCYDF